MPHWPGDRTPETGAALLGLWDFRLYFRIPDHPRFDPQRVYRALALEDFGPSTTAQLFFITVEGYVWAVPQTQCLCVVERASVPAGARHLEFVLPDPLPPSDWV